MTYRSLRIGFAWLSVIAAISLGCHTSQRTFPADLVLRNGIIYTVDEGRSVAEALAIKDGRIEYVGTDSGSTGYIGNATRVIDLGRRLVLPGFIDSHCHPTSAYKYFGIRLHAITGLSRIRDPRVAPCLVQMLKDPEREVQKHVIRSLGELKDPRTASILQQIAANRGDREFHALAKDALEKIGPPGI